jgi:hypothetical protein
VVLPLIPNEIYSSSDCLFCNSALVVLPLLPNEIYFNYSTLHTSSDPCLVLSSYLGASLISIFFFMGFQIPSNSVSIFSSKECQHIFSIFQKRDIKYYNLRTIVTKINFSFVPKKEQLVSKHKKYCIIPTTMI